jgi:hypothetical protein
VVLFALDGRGADDVTVNVTVALILLAQAVSGPPVPNELRKIAPQSSAPCPATSEGGEIIVCGRRSEDQRLAKLPETDKAEPSDRLSFRLPGGGKGNIHAFQSNVGGFTGQGVAVTLKIPFGKGKKK